MEVTSEQHHLLESEFEHTAVPLNKRKSLMSVTLVWVGFPMIITGAITGAALVAGLGFQKALWAMLIGNLMMFAYVGLLSAQGAKLGLNYALMASRTFGTRGYAISSGLLSTIVVGWYAVQTGLTGVSMNAAFHVSVFWTTLLAGVMYLIITVIGIRALSFVGLISAPLFVILGIYAVMKTLTNGGAVWSYAGVPNHAMSFGLAITIVFALFADAGTMTADFTRWAKNRKHATIATFAAFPFANFVAMLIGGIIAAAVPKNSGDVFSTIAAQGGFLAVLAVIFIFVNLGSVCSHCLYNASVGWSHIVGGKMRVLAVILGAIGITVAALGIWNFFIDWLNILGVLVPPIGTILILDQYVARRTDTIEIQGFRSKPFIAWGIGSAVALFVNFKAPNLSTVVAGIVTAGLAFLLLSLSDIKANQRNNELNAVSDATTDIAQV